VKVNHVKALIISVNLSINYCPVANSKFTAEKALDLQGVKLVSIVTTCLPSWRTTWNYGGELWSDVLSCARYLRASANSEDAVLWTVWHHFDFIEFCFILHFYLFLAAVATW